MPQVQVTTSQQAVTSYWELAQQLSGIDATICWCQNRGLLSSQKDSHCGRSCRVVKRSRYHTVNDSQNFVDPTTGSHTQSVESMWNSCKKMMRKTHTMQSQLFHTYLPEFMWRKRFHGSHQNAFNNIIDCIAEQYPIL